MKRIIPLVLLGLLIACGKNEEKRVPQKRVSQQLEQRLDLDKVIVRTPEAIVAITAPLEIEFRDPMIPAHLKGTVLDQNPFTFEPNIEGHAKWQSRRILRFIPDEHLPAGERIDATLHGKVAFGQQKNVNDFHFSFQVAEQEVLSLEGDFEVVPGEKNGVKYSGVISFAQPVDLAKIKERLVFTGPAGALALTFLTRETESYRVRFVSGLLRRKLKGQNFTFSLPGEYMANNKKWQKAVFLPGVGVFRVMAHMDMTTPESDQLAYAFRFNDPIKANIDLSGFISITPAVAYQVSIKGKRLIVQGDFDPGRSYQAKITKGFPCEFGARLADDYFTKFSFSNTKPEVKWLSEGVYLPSDNQYKLQFKSVNVGRVHISVTEIYPQYIGFFVQTNALVDQSSQPRGRYYYNAATYRDLSRVGETIFRKKFEIDTQKNKWVKTEFDLGPIFKGKKNSAFVVQMNFGPKDLTGPCVNSQTNLPEGALFYEGDDYYNNPCSAGYYNARGRLSKLLISSDIGLTVKKTDDGIHAFATNVLTARPAKSLTLNLYNYYNELLETQSTDSDGHAHFSDKDNKGAYIFADHSSGLALIKVNHPLWQLNNFDVAGSSGGKQGTDVFMYTDRGVHRPGDTIHFSAIVRMNRAAPPKKQPVILKVKNPKGQIIHETKTNCGFNGHVYFPVETDLSDPTGDWRAELTVGDKKFYKTLKVETVKPNRLKIAVELPSEIYDQNLLTGRIAVKYLFGAPAANLKTRIKVDLTSKRFRPDKFSDYIFSTPLKKYTRRSHSVFDGNLDPQGVHELNDALPDPKQAPALLRAMLHTTVYEKGGSFVEERRPITIYPFSAFVGLKDVFQWRRAKIGENYDVPIVAVNAEGEPVSGHKLKVKLYVNTRHWWWHYDRRDRKDFRRMASTYLVSEFSYTSKSEPIKHPVAVEDYGQHLLEVTDLTSGHQTGLFFYGTGWGRAPVEDEKERNYLQISADKNIYNVGDRARLTFETPEQGMALFSIEQGNKIIHREWKPVEAGQTSFSFPITEELIPNCYASISLIQPHNQNSNDLPMRLYGIKTVYVEEPSTRLPLSFSVPQELKPKESFTVEVTSGAPGKATYTIAVVDEGLLDLTDFKTPLPWEHYFKKLRLGVRTADNFDDIVGVLYPDIDKYFSIGGGFEDSQREKRLDRSRVKRFKPVVLFHKPITIEPGESIETSFTMPNYVGSVRIMVVGTSGHSYTSLEETVPVKQPLMILTTLPRVARPGDTFDLPVSIFAMDNSVRKVNLSLSLSANLEAAGISTQQIQFTQPGEKDAVFSVTVGNSVGADTATVLASSGSVSADNTVHLPITSANPFYTEVTDTLVQKDHPLVLIPKKFGLEGTNAARIAFTRLPDIQLDKRVAYLIRYPYGCIEQTISSAFPQIFLPRLVDMNSHQKQAVTDHINAAIKKLARFKMSNGFSFWPISTFHKAKYSAWGSSYAGHFLLEARELGYHVPENLYQHWLRDAQNKAKNVNRKNHRYQTYRLFLLSLAGEPHVGAMNLVRENYLADLDPLSRKLLAVAYHLSGKKDVAEQIERSAPTEVNDYRELSGTYGSVLRDRAFLTYLCVKMGDARTAATLLRQVAKSFAPYKWYSTQETAMAMLSIGAYYAKFPFPGGSVKFRVKLGNKKEEKMTLDGYQTKIDLENMWDKKIVVKTKHDNPLFVTLFVEGVPLENRITSGYNGIQLQRNFYDEDGRPITVDERTQGKPFWVIYTVRSLYRTPLNELALSSIFPSGWEIVNTRLTGEKPPQWVLKKRISSGEFMDVRDDRVNWFFDLRGGQKTTFGVKINPTFKGSYTQPPVVVEAMYSPEFYARIAAGKVRVW